MVCEIIAPSCDDFQTIAHEQPSLGSLQPLGQSLSLGD